jgi:4-hydroxy-3-methylbut-2-enyl diphosphate reductase
MRDFNIPDFYRSDLIGRVKAARAEIDPKKKDKSPSFLRFGNVEIILARHFGFCFGVENAIEISYRAIEENPGKRIFLLSQMIHNQLVNDDLQARGLQFIMDTGGNQLIPWEEIQGDDIVIIPAFGTSLETMAVLEAKGIELTKYDTTCPFVTRVWKKAEKLSKSEYALVIHGKAAHEETRATFSHSSKNSPSVIVRDMTEARSLGRYIRAEGSREEFFAEFKGKHSPDFDPDVHLNRFGVINQTTMLATETQEITDYLKEELENRWGKDDPVHQLADTRDTLCYATNDNQEATYALLQEQADLAIVVGGYNSSNTSHLVELCEEKVATFFIQSEEDLISEAEIEHFDLHAKKVIRTKNWLPDSQAPLRLILTSGASCPDSLIERVLHRLESICNFERNFNDSFASFMEELRSE